jgi:hypothetical protein
MLLLVAFAETAEAVQSGGLFSPTEKAGDFALPLAPNPHAYADDPRHYINNIVFTMSMMRG